MEIYSKHSQNTISSNYRYYNINKIKMIKYIVLRFGLFFPQAERMKPENQSCNVWKPFVLSEVRNVVTAGRLLTAEGIKSPGLFYLPKLDGTAFIFLEKSWHA